MSSFKNCPAVIGSSALSVKWKFVLVSRSLRLTRSLFFFCLVANAWSSLGTRRAWWHIGRLQMPRKQWQAMRWKLWKLSLIYCFCCTKIISCMRYSWSHLYVISSCSSICSLFLFVIVFIQDTDPMTSLKSAVLLLINSFWGYEIDKWREIVQVERKKSTTSQEKNNVLKTAFCLSKELTCCIVLSYTFIKERKLVSYHRWSNCMMCWICT